jgi:hypothetical protein
VGRGTGRADQSICGPRRSGVSSGNASLALSARRAAPSDRHLFDLSRISHTLSAAAHDMAASTSLRSLTVLNVVFKQLPRAELRAPRIHGLLTRLATKPCEKRRLRARGGIRKSREIFEFLNHHLDPVPHGKRPAVENV